MASRWCDQQTRRRPHLWITLTTVERVMAGCAMFIRRRSTVTVSTPLLRFCSGFVVQLVPTLLFSSWQDLDWHSASHGPSAVAELLVSTGIVLLSSLADTLMHN